MPETLYLTGFGPFPGVEINPTEALARQLDGLHFGSLRVQSEVLPVAFDRAANQTRAALSTICPEYIVHLGVATTAETLRLETRAVNCADTNLHDVDADADAPRKPGTRIESPDTLGRKCWAFAYLRQLWAPDQLLRATAAVPVRPATHDPADWAPVPPPPCCPSPG